MIQEPRTLAAVDLGSNSFHMVIARADEGGALTVLDRLKIMVRLGGGLDERGSLTEEAKARALEALELFGELLRPMGPGSVRAVGTNTLRKAKDSEEFLRRAEAALGHPIEVISGREEGRLVFLGVAHDIFDPERRRRLVVDIGGGSTEVIIGRGLQVEACESLYMGCVSFSRRFFEDNRITRGRVKRAVLAARQELRAIENAYPRLGWERAIGSSGTIRAVDELCRARGFDSITPEALARLRSEAIAAGSSEALAWPELSERREPVFIGGLCVLIAVFEALGLTSMVASRAALREGALHDLYGRVSREDVREEAIAALIERYGVDRAHGERVERSAASLWGQVKEAWELDDPRLEAWLRWACRVHEIGLAVAHARYHKHGSYLIENSDLAGFSKLDQHVLWSLVRSHRRSFKPHRFEGLPGTLTHLIPRLCVLLRLAVVLQRARADDTSAPEPRLSIEGPNKLTISFPPKTFDDAPLLCEDLKTERRLLKEGGFRLKIA